jgi:hypothetical protein
MVEINNKNNNNNNYNNNNNKKQRSKVKYAITQIYNKLELI